MPGEKRKRTTIYSQPSESSTPKRKKGGTENVASTSRQDSPFAFPDDEEFLEENGESPNEELDDPGFDVNVDEQRQEVYNFVNLDHGIPPGLDADVINEILETMNFPEKDLMSEGEGDDPEELENAPEEEELSLAQELLMNMMPTAKPRWLEKPPREEDEESDDEDEVPEVQWGRNYSGQLDGGIDIQWSVDPPSPSDLETYELTSRAPATIQLAKKFEYLQGERNPHKFLDVVLPDQLLNEIIHNTNKYAYSILGDNWKRLDLIEMRAFIGCLIYIGERGLSDVSWDDLFKVNTYSVNIPLKRAISRDRFKEIMRFMRFDDKTARTKETEKNKLAKIENVFEQVIKNCRRVVKPSKFIVVDESAVSYRGGVSFKMYNPSKPDPYHMKVFSLCDGITGAILNAQVYTGMEGDTPEVGQGKRVVMDLVKPYLGSGRIVVTDRFYTSIGLAQELRSNGLEFLGTMMENRKGLPNEFRNLDLHRHYNGKPLPKPKNNKKRKGKGGKKASKKAKKTSEKAKKTSKGGKKISKKVGGKSKNGESGNSPRPQGSPIRPLRLVRRVDDFQVEQPPATAPVVMPMDSIDLSIESVVKETAPAVASPAKKGRKRKADKDAVYSASDPKSAFLFSDHLTVVKYEAKEDKKVTLLSTIHHSPTIRNDWKAKPNIILTYNERKYAVDLLDQMAKHLSTIRIARRWPMRMFFWLLDVALITAYIAYKAANPDLDAKEQSRRVFHQRMAVQMMKPNVRRRENDPRLRQFVKLLSKAVLATRLLEKSFDKYLDESVTVERTKELASTPVKRITKSDVMPGKIDRRNAPRCYACAKNKSTYNKKAYRHCSSCGKPVCTKHSESVGGGPGKKFRCIRGEDAVCDNI